MIDWATVAAFIVPLIGAMGSIAAWYAWLAKKRDARVAQQIKDATTPLITSQMLMQQQMDSLTASQARIVLHLDKQDESLSTAMQGIAEIKGRLAGQVTGPSIAN